MTLLIMLPKELKDITQFLYLIEVELDENEESFGRTHYTS